MPKMNCNIIKDLLPSYLDEICSTESRQLLDEHFNECEDCKKLYEQTKLEMLHTNSSSAREIDIFKKIKTNMSHKNAAILVISTLLLIVELYYNLITGSSNLLNYFFPLIMGGLLFVILPDYAENKVSTRFKFIFLGVELAAITLIFSLLFYSGKTILDGGTPFGIEPSMLGPSIASVILTVLIGFIIAFVTTLFLSIKKRTVCPSLIFVSLEGIAFAIECIHYLHEFGTRFTLMHIVDPLSLFTVETVLLIIIYKVVNRKKTV